MYRTITRAILGVIITFLFVCHGVSVAEAAHRLLTINDVVYTDEDFKNWWKHWNDKNELNLQSSQSEFIDFQLLVQQGLEMGYDTQPGYLRKLEVFLQVRAMMALKYEEVDSKVTVSDVDLRKYFDENYGTVWTLQILTFDNESKAQKVYEAMIPYKGVSAGRLVFADWYGGDIIDVKSQSYDEVKVTAADFFKNKRGSWLPVVKNLDVDSVSMPFAIEENKFILIRLADKQPADESTFEEKRQKMTELLFKEKRNQLTIDLIETLKKKYNVSVDQELVKSIKIDAEYPKDFQAKKIITMNEFHATVYDLINNIKKEKFLRKDVADDELKYMVLNTIISQTLVNKESLARGYENRPPLSYTYNFYKQNRLRAEVESGLLKSVLLSEQDLQNYYSKKIASFTVPEKVTYSLLQGDEETLKKVWLGVVQGSEFNELAQKYSLDSPSQTKDLIDLSPVLIGEIKRLDKGAMSQPFSFEGKFALVMLFDRVPGQVHPLAQVKEQVVEQLKKEKFEMLKSEYIDKLKSKSKIDVNERVWNGILRELGNGKKG